MAEVPRLSATVNTSPMATVPESLEVAAIPLAPDTDAVVPRVVLTVKLVPASLTSVSVSRAALTVAV